MQEGDRVLNADGEAVRIACVELEILEESVTVYNFEVADWHTYYVSEEEVLVHNDCTAGGSGTDKVLGGSFQDVNAIRGIDEVGHHMPQNKFNEKELGMTRNDGAALLMTKKDHALTRTYRGRGKQTMILDKGLTARQRMALDILNIRENFGTKYNKGMLEAIKYAKTLSGFQK